MLHAIPVGSGRDALAAMQAARRELEAGHVVCIFAEGAISRTGNLLPFKRGLEKIVDGLDVPIVPVYLDRVWGSVFSFKGGRFLWKWPARIPYPVTVLFGAPLASSTPASEVRLALMTAGAAATALRRSGTDSLGRKFIRAARRRPRAFCMADAGTPALNRARALTASLLLARWIRRHAADQPRIGLLLPASVGGALANIAVALAGRAAVNLNFTAGRAAMRSAADRCGLRTILTSRKFVEKVGIEPLNGMVFLEDLLGSFGAIAKGLMAAAVFVLPARALSALWAADPGDDSTAAIVFSSGSTGTPKGVELSHRNVLANIDAIAQVFQLRDDDVMVGVLPLFHSFGYTVTLWLPAVIGFGAVFHPNPADGKAIGELAERYRGTILVSTPTFYAGYLRRCRREHFAHVRYALAGAERLRESVAEAFREKFGITLLEGYGCTEMAPVAAVNAPDVDEHGLQQRGSMPGTVGHPLPGVAAKIVDPVTGEGPLIGVEGLLLLAGPNRMRGYFDDPGLTGDVLRDGWYVTGDIASIDEAGFIRITDRLSRFSKIAGEMVPHMRVEAEIQQVIDGHHSCAVTAVPDEIRGERLVAFYTDPLVTPATLWERLCRSELPRLWLPRRDDLRFVETIPTLGTGKVDLRGVRELAARIGEEVA